MATKNRKTTGTTTDTERVIRTRKILENIAMAGMTVIAVSLVLPLFHLTDSEWLPTLKWVYASGALLYLVSRIWGAVETLPEESMRLRRLRRMPAWAGVAFGIAAGFWFYSEGHLGEYAGPLAILRQTIMFSLVGAVLQIVSSWMIYSREQKEKREG